MVDFRPGRAIVDGRMKAIGRLGTPDLVSLPVILPASLWGGAAVVALEEWAEANRVVHIAFREGRDGTQVRLRDDRYDMALDLVRSRPRTGPIGQLVERGADVMAA